MRRGVFTFLFGFIFIALQAQQWAQKFEQFGAQWPTPNSYRTGSGAPGTNYWQQQVDYNIDVAIDENKLVLYGKSTITYHNNSPQALNYLWLQLDQNVRAKDNLKDQTNQFEINSNMHTKELLQELGTYDYNGGHHIKMVTDSEGTPMEYTINRTMMRVDLTAPLGAGEKKVLNIEWSYNLYDRMLIDGRGGYEYFPEDGNYAFTCAQWYPRLCVYDDVEGWQNQQFIGEGEFALEFGDFEVNITVPADHIVAATGLLQNESEVLTKTQQERLAKARNSTDKAVIIATQQEAQEREKSKSTATKTWQFKAANVRDFAFATSRKYIWDAQAVKLPTNTVLAMSLYPKEGNGLWGDEGTKAVKNALEVYSARTIDYPYPVAIAINAANQGMEYPMICFNGSRPSGKNGKYTKDDVSALVDVVVHEVGHNYFPMIINSDERKYGWFDEGLNTFLELQTKRERYPQLDTIWGAPKSVAPFMMRFGQMQNPIMTQPDNMLMSWYTNYGKPSAALDVLRNAIMGPELFDMAFKTYAQRWQFKRPKPEDFFRTMEDASAVDLDWFWRAWFYTIEHVDVGIDDVKWYRMRTENSATKNQKALPFTLLETPDRFYGEFKNRVDDKAILAKLGDKNFYEITFTNYGGIVSPLILVFTFEDGTLQTEKIPAEIWRLNEQTVNKVFYFDKI